MPVLLQNVDLSWSQQTIKHWRFDICLLKAMTIGTWNGALDKENCYKCPCCLQKKGKQQYIIPIRKRSNGLHACYTQRESVTSALSFERTILHTVLSQQGCEKMLWQIGNNYLSGHTSTQSTSSCLHHFQGCRAIHICLSYTQIPKKNTHSSSTERGLLLSHMLSCADTAISI